MRVSLNATFKEIYRKHYPSPSVQGKCVCVCSSGHSCVSLLILSCLHFSNVEEAIDVTALPKTECENNWPHSVQTQRCRFLNFRPESDHCNVAVTMCRSSSSSRRIDLIWLQRPLAEKLIATYRRDDSNVKEWERESWCSLSALLPFSHLMKGSNF